MIIVEKEIRYLNGHTFRTIRNPVVDKIFLKFASNLSYLVN